MGKKFIIISLLMVVPLIIAVSLLNKIKVLSSDDNSKEKQYLYIDTADNLNHTLYKLDVNTKEQKLLLKKSIGGEYPTSTYSEKNKKVYFSKAIGNKSTQLFEKDLKNNHTKQLTKDLSFIDFLSP